MESLLSHLDLGNELSLEPLLDLTTQLARDLGPEFYPHFPSVFKVFLKILNKFPQQTQVLEWTFTALSFLFKFLWRYIIKDLEGTFEYVLDEADTLEL